MSDSPSVNSSRPTRTFEEQMRVARNHSGAVFCQFRFDYSRHFKGDTGAAAVLGFVLNKLRLKADSAKDQPALLANEMWFQCPCDEIERHFGMSEDRRKRILKTLVEAGVVEVQYRLGHKMWVRVRTEALTAIEEADAGPLPRAGSRETPDPPRNQRQRGGNPGSHLRRTYRITSTKRGGAVPRPQGTAFTPTATTPTARLMPPSNE